jgi:2,3-bisphosphoglycerate-independent phosphoglycerate mutase
MKKPVILVIMDGYGIRKETYGNAIAKANKPNLDKYFLQTRDTNDEKKEPVF